MRITLAQWIEYGLPTFQLSNERDRPKCAECEGDGPAGQILVVKLCVYHEGFVDGFDAARGGG